LRNDTNSNRSKLIIASKKLINAYDLLAGFCYSIRTIQLKRRFAGLTRQPAGDRLQRGEAEGDSPRPRRVLRDRAREKKETNKNGEERQNDKARGRENGNTKKRWRSLGSPFNVICNTGWPNDATGRDRTGIRVEACERVGDSPWISSLRRVPRYTKEGI